jgi:hypothetical protein
MTGPPSTGSRGPVRLPEHRSTYRGGAGDRMVLIDGRAGIWRQWRPVIPLLEPHHEVLAISLLGHWGGLIHRMAQLMAGNPARWSRRPRLRRLLYWHHFAHPRANGPGRHGGAPRAGPDSMPGPARTPCGGPRAAPPPHGQPLIDAIPTELHDLPGVGHVASCDDPQLVAQAIFEFTSSPDA